MRNRIAIIPARCGSKGLKDKNIKDLCGMPLLAYSIQSAKESGKFDKILVSTDSEKYAEIAKKYGAEVPFLRSPELSGDTAGSWDVVKEVIERLEMQGEKYDQIMLLQPTSPLRKADDIEAAFDLLEKRNADAVISVCEMEHSPLWSNTLPADGDMSDFEDERYNCPRQMLPVYYRINGAIYLLKTEELYRVPMFKQNCYAYIMDRDRSIDIDEELDFIIAEAILQQQIRNDRM